jgi:glycosyltransferase involved in cell wall biosynthesis
MRTKISVLIPCYNAAETVREALQSIQQQTFSDLEIVAVDDGSTDMTLAILRQMAQDDPRLHIISCKHAGIVETLNEGLTHCHAPLVARMDADDISLPKRFELQVKAFKEKHDN